MNERTDQPKFIAHYRVAQPLGSGGMGEVFLAEDTKLDRSVALKLLPKEVASDASRRKRFLAEAKAASALNHSNVCTIYEVGETAEGQPFIAMEYLEGQTLEALARRRRLDLREIVGIGMQVAEALEAARQHQVVHRDIKPGNIMVDAQGRVKVLDFGLAKRLDQAGEASMLTQEGAILGTPNYLSPEMALGREVDSRTDLFSLGVVLYELAAGRNPFAGASFGETVNNILNKNPEPLKPWNPTVTPEFERIVFKSLEKDASKRYGTPAQLRDDLMKLRASLQTPRSSDQRLWAVAAIVLVLGVIGLGALWLTRPRPATHAPSPGRNLTMAKQKSVAVLPFVNMSPDKGDEYLSDGISEEIITALSKVKGLKVPARTSCFVFKGKNEDIQKIGQQLHVGTVLEGSISKTGNKVRVMAQLINIADGFHIWSETYDRALDDLLAIRTDVAGRVAEALKGQLLGEERQELAKRGTENAEAYRLYLQGRYLWNRRTPEEIKQAIAYFDRAIRADPVYALAYAGMADCYDVLPFYTGASRRDALPMARAAALKALELDRSLAEPHATLADVQAYLDWDWSGGEKEFRQAIALNPNYATAHHWFANVLDVLGRHDEALAETRRALEIDPLSRIFNASLGFQLFLTGKADAGIEVLRKQIAFDPSFVVAHDFLGGIYCQQGKLPEALVEAETMHRLDATGTYGLGGLGAVYAKLGRTDDVRKILDQMQDLQRQGIDYRVGIAWVQHVLGENESALDSLEKGMTERAFGLESLYCDPIWKDLRPHPRAQAILRKMNLVSASTTNAPPATSQKSVAVLPFVNLSADKNDEYLSDGLSEDLSIALTQVKELQVRTFQSCRAFKGKTDDIRKIGDQLRAVTVLTGSVTRDGSNLWVNVRLGDTVNDTELWAERYERTMTNILDIRNDIAQQVVKALKVQLRVEETRALVKKPTDNAEAYALCIQARSWSDQATSEGFTNALKLYQRAIALDPGYALAYAGMASAYTMVADWLLPTRTALEAAKTNVETSLRLDEALAPAHLVLGYIRGDYEWDHEGQKQEYERALVLAPNLADAHLRYGSYLRHMKRFGEAKVAFKRALELDPVSPLTHNALAYVDFLARDYPKSLELSRATVSQFPSSIWGHIRLAWVCEQLGRHEEAISEMARVRSIEDSPDLISRLAHMYASAGQTNEVLRLQKELEDWQKRAYVSPTFFAWVHLGMGQTNESISRLQEAVELRDGFLTELNSDPYYDPIRSDPRFIALLRKTGLPK